MKGYNVTFAPAQLLPTCILADAVASRYAAAGKFELEGD
jgi:hypothetical protein